MTANDVIMGALLLLGVAAEGDDSGNLTDSLNNGIPFLNQLIDSANIRYALIFTVIPRQLPLAAGTASYQWGLGAIWNFPRPIKIESGGIIFANGLKTILQPTTSAEWAAIPDKAMMAKQPLRFYNDNNYPSVTINLWPAPNANVTFEAFAWEELPSVVNLTDVIIVPPGYERYLKYSLAVMLAPSYGLLPQAIAGIIDIAQQSAQELGVVNATDSAASLAPAPPGPAT